MALKRRRNGTFEVKTKAQAVEALQQMTELEEAVKEISKETGIDEMMLDAVELKKAATAYLAEKNIKALEIPKASKVAKLIEGSEGQWIGTKADMPTDAPAGVSPLKALVPKEMWRRITRRVVDPQKVQAAINAGDLIEDEISDAFYEKPRAAYVRLYDDN